MRYFEKSYHRELELRPQTSFPLEDWDFAPDLHICPQTSQTPGLASPMTISWLRAWLDVVEKEGYKLSANKKRHCFNISSSDVAVFCSGALRGGSRGYLRYRARIFHGDPKFWKFRALCLYKDEKIKKWIDLAFLGFSVVFLHNNILI